MKISIWDLHVILTDFNNQNTMSKHRFSDTQYIGLPVHVDQVKSYLHVYVHYQYTKYFMPEQSCPLIWLL